MANFAILDVINHFNKLNIKTISIHQNKPKSRQTEQNKPKMSNFIPILQQLIEKGVKINHYPQFNYFEVLDFEGSTLLRLYTQKSSFELAKQYNLSVNQLIRNRYYKFEVKLKIELL